MSQFEFPAEIIDFTEILGRRATHNSESFAILEPQTDEHQDIPNGLVVSANDRIRATLGEALLLCGMAPTLSSSVAESGKHLKAGDLSVVICEDLLPGGRYSDLLQLQQQSANSTQSSSFPERVTGRSISRPSNAAHTTFLLTL